jgi:hypothetical protein
MFLDAENFNKIDIDGEIPINKDNLEKLIKILDEECRKNNKNEKRVKEFIGGFCEKGLIDALNLF